jgi:hypothetical protein
MACGSDAEREAGTEGDELSAAAAAKERESRARARAYLDLWERQVVQTALHGSGASWRPTRS